jgi:hypothetical protein
MGYQRDIFAEEWHGVHELAIGVHSDGPSTNQEECGDNRLQNIFSGVSIKGSDNRRIPFPMTQIFHIHMGTRKKGYDATTCRKIASLNRPKDLEVNMRGIRGLKLHWPYR